MAATIFIEQESGTSRGWVHPHNGYYAGDFSSSGATGGATTSIPAQALPHLSMRRHSSTPTGGA